MRTLLHISSAMTEEVTFELGSGGPTYKLARGMRSPPNQNTSRCWGWGNWTPCMIGAERSKMAGRVTADACAADCGKESSDAVELKNCAACRLVKYCSVDYQKTHRKQHKRACKLRARGRAEGRATLHAGKGAARGGFLPDMQLLPIPFIMNEHSGLWTWLLLSFPEKWQGRLLLLSTPKHK